MADNKYSRTAEKDHAKLAAEKLRVSFEYLDLSLSHFFMHGLAADHYRKIFDCINTVADATEEEIVQQKHNSLEPKSIFNTAKGTYKRFPEAVEAAIADKLAAKSKGVDPLDKASVKAAEDTRADAKIQAKKIVERAFEVRISKGYGRIHGIVWDKVFYIVWFDPAHNLYPRALDGVRLHEAYAKVKCFGPETVTALREAHVAHCGQFNAELAQLKTENDELLAEWAAR